MEKILKYSKVYQLATCHKGIAYEFRFFLYTILRIVNLRCRLVQHLKSGKSKRLSQLNRAINFVRLNDYIIKKQGCIWKTWYERLEWEFATFATMLGVFLLFGPILFQ